MALKMAPVSAGDVLIGLVVVGGAYVLYTAAVAFKETAGSAGTAVSDFIHGGAVKIVADTVDVRKNEQDPSEISLGGIQQAVSNTVQRGQDAGATNFISAYLKGLFL